MHHGEGILLFVCQSGVLGQDNYAMQNHGYKILACSIFTLKTCKFKKNCGDHAARPPRYV